MIRLTILLFVWLLPFTASAQSTDKPYVVLVSFDGFRYDYAERYNLPHFQQMIREGASSEAMIPSYPSKTFPNHYTIVTGLYPNHHGLVDNTFYDSIRDVNYATKKRELVEDAFYYGGVPLWQLTSRNGMKSASYFWIGSEAPVDGQYPDYYEIYNGSVPDRERIQSVVNWLSLPEPDRPHFISLYFSVIDDAGHKYGPDAKETKQALYYADSLLGELMSGVTALDLPVNIIIVSDHGMYPMTRDPERVIQLSEVMDLPKNKIRMINNETHVHVYCEEPLRGKLYAQARDNENHYRAYLREASPEHWHYNSHYRIGDIILEAEPGYGFQKNSMRRETYGSHGFDPTTTPEMGAIFYAIGPNIKKGVRLPPFENIHVYPLIAHILGLPIGTIDGSLDVLEGILAE